MCRMLAKVAVRAFTPVYELLEAPHSLRRQSQCGRQPDAPDTCGPHASGCGMAWRNGGGLEIEKRGPDDRWDESFAAKVRSVSTRALIAHNRLASPGLKLDATLAHPFVDQFQGSPVAFCHNGGIRDLMDEAQRLGITDSQLFFREILSSSRELDHESLRRVLDQLSKRWSYSSLSAMLLMPDRLHVWRCYDANDPRKEDFEKYYTLWIQESDGSLVIASEPVDQDANWSLLPNGTLLTIEMPDQPSESDFRKTILRSCFGGEN